MPNPTHTEPCCQSPRSPSSHLCAALCEKSGWGKKRMLWNAMIMLLFLVEVKTSIPLHAIWKQPLPPTRPQDLTFNAHLLALINLCLALFLKLFFLAYLLPQASETQSHASSDDNCQDLPQAQTTQSFWARLILVWKDHGVTSGAGGGGDDSA